MEKILTELELGQRAKITKVKGNGAIRRRMIDMGVVPGMEVTLERYAPLGDPIEIRLKGCYISLRKEEASHILIEEIGGNANEV